MIPVRIQRRRMRGWRMPPNTVSVTRPGPLGNPFRIGDFVDVDGRHVEIKTALHARTLYMENVVAFNLRLAQHPGNGKGVIGAREWIERVRALRGKNLACFCPLDQPCHADVLLELANK